MTIKTKIMLLGLLAVASLAYVLGVRIVTGSREHAAKLEFVSRMESAEKLSALVHELQKERGITAGYLVIPSKRNTDLLDSQRAAANQARARLDETVGHDLDYLARLADVRRNISAQQMSPVSSFGYYTQTIMEILDRIDALARDSGTVTLKSDLHTYVYLLYAKEYLGQIRASINESLSEGRIDKERVAVVIRQLNSHQYYSRMILREAAPEIARAIGAVLAQPRVQHTFAMVEAVLAGSDAAPAAEQWFAMASYSIDQLLTVETQALSALRQHARADIAANERRLLIDVAITLVAALALIFFAASVGLSLLRALNVLVGNIEHAISAQDFPKRIPLQGNPGTGVIPRNFNELISVAEHLVKEKGYFASTDLLTGAYHRHRFPELFEIERQRVLRYGGGLALIMFDIDRFKSVNDEFGHGVGDLVLKEIAHLVRDLTRANDVLVRWSGEEFMLLVPHAGDETSDLAETLRVAVVSHCFPRVPKVTASFGVSAFAPDDTLETLYARTDEALYRAKHLGRNCVCTVAAGEARV